MQRRRSLAAELCNCADDVHALVHERALQRQHLLPAAWQLAAPPSAARPVEWRTVLPQPTRAPLWQPAAALRHLLPPHLPALPSHRLQPRHRPQHGAQLTARPRPPKLPECGQHRYSRVVSTLKAAVRARSGGRTHALTSPFECAMKNPQWRFARPKVDRRQRTCPSDVTGRRSTRAPRPAGTSLSCAAVAAAGLLDAIFKRQNRRSDRARQKYVALLIT